MTIIVPDGVETLGNEAVWFVPAIVNTSAPTVAELTAGVPLQCALTSAFNPNGEQSSGEDVRLCSRDTFEAPGRNRVTIDALEYVYDPQAPEDTTEYKAYSMLEPGTKGFIVDRRGLAHETAWTAAQVVDVYPVTLGERNRVPVELGADGQKFRTSQKPFATGARVLDAVVAT